MKINEFSVKRPVTVMMIFLLFLIIGIIALRSLSLDILPSMEIPSLTVFTIYPQASPEEVEKKVTEVLERSLSRVSNLKDINSVSMEGVSTITLSFNWGTNLDEAINDIRRFLDFASFQLPQEVQRPTVFKFDFSMAPILFYGIEVDENLSSPEIYIQKNIVDTLMRVPGVGMINFRGFPEEIVAIELSQKKMKKYGINLNMVMGMLSGYNISVPGGGLDIGKRYVMVKIDDYAKDLKEIGDITILRHGGKTVYLKDIATVDFTPKRDIISSVKVNGKRGGILVIQRASGENTVTVADNVMKEIARLQKDHDQIKISLFFSLADFIKQTINNLGNTLLLSIIFVTLVVLLLLLNFRGALIIVLAIPFSMIIAFIFMYLFGYNLNMMSLGALVIAVGMVVDSAVVIYENIFRHRYLMKEPLRESTIFAPSEVGMAITASVLTTIAIFFPLIFVRGLIGVMFKQMGVIVTIVLFASLLVSMTFIPALSYLILPKKGTLNVFQQKLADFWGRVSDKIASLVKRSLRFGGFWIAGFFTFFIITIFLLNYIPKEFMPSTDQGMIDVNMILPTDVNIGESQKMADDLQKLIFDNIPEKKLIYYNVGTGRRGMSSSVSPNRFQLSISLHDKVPTRRPTEDISNEIRDLIQKNISGYRNFSVSSQDQFAASFSGGEGGLVLEIYGDGLDSMNDEAHKWRQKFMELPEIRNALVSYELGKNELQIVCDHERTARAGLTPAQVGMAIRIALYGSKVGEFRKEGDVYDVFITYERDEFPDIESLRSFVIYGVQGNSVRLEDVADFIYEKGPVEIERKNRFRMITVSGILTDSKHLGKLTTWLEDEIKNTPEEFTYRIAGGAKDMQDSFRSLIQILIFSILVVFMIMASQFESLKEPFIIMFSVPFAFSGVVLGLLITNQTLSVTSMIGLIMLMGIVVNNAIVLVDYINLLRRRGNDIKSAIELAVSNRFKPILMTTITTVFGMLPLALSKGVGSESFRPLSIAVISGLLISTTITMFLIPNIYYIIEKKSRMQKLSIY